MLECKMIEAPASNYRFDLNSPKWDICSMEQKPRSILKRGSNNRHLADCQLQTLLRPLRCRLAAINRSKQSAVSIHFAGRKRIHLPRSKDNFLLGKIFEEFCPRFVPGSTVVYLGDTKKRFEYFDTGYLRSLGVVVEEHGKIPDVIVHFKKKNWLVLVEAVTRQGPMNPKRLTELNALFASSKAGLVFVTAFLNHRGLLKYFEEIAWETTVWVADTPDHMIHFNGERFLGPY